MCSHTTDIFDSQDELREEIIEKVKWNIERDSMEDKQRALLELFDPLKKDLKHQVLEITHQRVHEL